MSSIFPHASPQGQKLLTSTMLFHFAFPLRRLETLWSDRELELGEIYRIPSMTELDEEVRAFADVRIGWNPSGIGVSIRVEGKRQQPWCRGTRPEESDGLYLFLDTRDARDIHRASRFCHQFVFLPTGGGRHADQSVVASMPISRAKELPKPPPAGALKVKSQLLDGGYLLRGMISSQALEGFDPAEHPRLGFNFVVIDRELGRQLFTGAAEFPMTSDPSLWSTLELKMTGFEPRRTRGGAEMDGRKDGG